MVNSYGTSFFNFLFRICFVTIQISLFFSQFFFSFSEFVVYIFKYVNFSKKYVINLQY